MNISGIAASNQARATARVVPLPAVHRERHGLGPASAGVPSAASFCRIPVMQRGLWAAYPQARQRFG